MPYSSTGELPAPVKKRYSPKCQQVFMRVFNQSHKNGDSEERAFQNAHAAATNCKNNT